LRKIVLLFVVALLAALPAAAEPGCDAVMDSRSYDDGGYNSWCWLSSMICYYCWGANPDEYCSNDWQPCQPSPRPKRPHPIVVDARPLAIAAPPCAAKTRQPDRPQVKLEHIL
jgi:hypothetical protein